MISPLVFAGGQPAFWLSLWSNSIKKRFIYLTYSTYSHGNSTANLPSWGFSPVRGSSTSGSHGWNLSVHHESIMNHMLHHASWTLHVHFEPSKLSSFCFGLDCDTRVCKHCLRRSELKTRFKWKTQSGKRHQTLEFTPSFDSSAKCALLKQTVRKNKAATSMLLLFQS